jgi:hypothetical protein
VERATHADLDLWEHPSDFLGFEGVWDRHGESNAPAVRCGSGLGPNPALQPLTSVSEQTYKYTSTCVHHDERARLRQYHRRSLGGCQILFPSPSPVLYCSPVL